jgi:tripartite-type tricarboxylate transporter receptor subunit TctC
VETWFGILAPAGTPPEIVEKLNSALKSTLSTPQIRERFLSYDVEASSSTSAELTPSLRRRSPRGAR